MLKAVLFDLDGTLLDIDMEFFLQKYFELMVSTAAKQGLDYSNLVEKIWAATELVISSTDGSDSNMDRFFAEFFRDGQYAPEVYTPFFDQFYETEFDRLKIHTQPFPLARPIVEKVFAKNYQVVIATNPIFPAKAIQLRLDWAGIGDFDYSLITTYEVMHYTKPHKEYYLEIVSKLGVKPEECLMVGNDVAEDLVAGSLGMKTFLLKERLIHNGEDPIKVDHQGYMPELLDLVKGLPDL